MPGAEIVTPFCSEPLRLCASFSVRQVLLWKVLSQEALEVGVQHDAFSPVEGSMHTHFQLSPNKIDKMPNGELANLVHENHLHTHQQKRAAYKYSM